MIGRPEACAGSGFEFMTNGAMTMCTECGADIEIGEVVVGEILQCGDCGVELEVLSIEPVELGLAPTEEEDWGE